MVAKEGKTVQSPDQKWKEPPVRVRFSRTGYMIMAWLFLICVIIQVFIAGMAI